MPGTILCAKIMELSKTRSLVLWSLHSSGVWRQKTNSHIKSESGKCYEKKSKDKRTEGIMVARLSFYTVWSEKVVGEVASERAQGRMDWRLEVWGKTDQVERQWTWRPYSAEYAGCSYWQPGVQWAWNTRRRGRVEDKGDQELGHGLLSVLGSHWRALGMGVMEPDWLL